MTTSTPAPALSSQRGAERVAARQAPAAGAAPVPITAADKAARLASIQADARKRAMVCYTIARTLLPKTDAAMAAKFASALIEAPTPLITAAFRQLATITAKFKLAEQFEDMSKTSLNEFVEKPELLSKLQGEVTSELKGDPKTASKHIAALEKHLAACRTAAENNEDFPPPPPELDIVGMTPNKQGSRKNAAPGDKPPMEEGTDPSLKAPAGDAAVAPPADMPASEPAPAAPPVPGDLGAAGEAAPVNDVVPDSGTDAGLMGQIEQVEADISKLEEEVGAVEDQALDLAGIFDPEIQAGKATGLANEDDEMTEMGGDDFFGPSSKDEMEGSMDFGAPETGNPQDFFAGNHNTASLQVDAFLAGRTASEEIVDGYDMSGEFATSLPGDGRNVETDHQGDMLSEVLDSLDIETMNQKRDTAPKMETPAPVQAAAAPNGGKTTAQAKAALAAGPKAPAPKRSSVNPGQPGIPRTAANDLNVTPAELDGLLFRDRF